MSGRAEGVERSFKRSFKILKGGGKIFSWMKFSMDIVLKLPNPIRSWLKLLFFRTVKKR